MIDLGVGRRVAERQAQRRARRFARAEVHADRFEHVARLGGA